MQELIIIYTLANTESYQKTYGSIECIAVYVNNERDNESQMSYNGIYKHMNNYACLKFTI